MKQAALQILTKSCFMLALDLGQDVGHVELMDLLQQVVMKDNRSEWRRWAEVQRRSIGARLDE